jgi:hypothetical protein
MRDGAPYLALLTLVNFMMPSPMKVDRQRWVPRGGLLIPGSNASAGETRIGRSFLGWPDQAHPGWRAAYYYQ